MFGLVQVCTLTLATEVWSTLNKVNIFDPFSVLLFFLIFLSAITFNPDRCGAFH